MEDITKKKLRELAFMVGLGAAIGIAYMPIRAVDAITILLAVKFAAQGALITGLIFGFEFFVTRGPASERLRRASFIAALFAKTVATTILIVFAYGVGGLVLFPQRFSAEMPIQDLTGDTIFAFAVALVLQFVLMMRTVVGGRVLRNIIMGRYRRPLREERIFMFLDVTGSTALAERLGDTGAYAMISRFFFDVAQLTARFDGETHRYIGDEVVVTWPMESGLADARCLSCYFAICDRIKARASAYEREFGAVPAFRVGIHGGPVVAGECGDDKHEIVYFGDTINTAARIEQACKEHDRRLLISGALLGRMDLPPGMAAVGLGKAQLRGHAEETELFTVERRGF